MRRQALIALLCTGVASCFSFGAERPRLHPALLANHAQHLTLVALDGEGLLRIQLEVDYHDPSWCPRFTLDVTVNGEAAEQVEDAVVVAGGEGCGSRTEFHCELPVFEYHYDPEQPLEAVRIELSDRSATFVAETEAPEEIARLELDHDLVTPGEVVRAQLVPEPRTSSQVSLYVMASGDSSGGPVNWESGPLRIVIPEHASPGEGYVHAAISDWIPLEVSCEGAKSCQLRLFGILARSDERFQTRTPFTVQ